jgi:inward rectifier potassium channel
MRRRPFGDVYHYLLNCSFGYLCVLLALVYTLTNALFALAYLAGGACIENARPGSFVDVFFFSVQTMATIGYGKMVPATPYANVLVTVEALTGLLGLAMATGLIFAKFSRPTARVLFSRVAVIATRDGVTSLIFRMANERNNQIVEAQLKLALLRDEVTREGEHMRRFHDLKLVRSMSHAFILSWTAVHPIGPDSPLAGHTLDTLRACNALFMVSLTGIEETFSQTVHARHTYLPEDVLFGARFVDVLDRGPDGRGRIDFTRFHDVVPATAQTG